MAIVTLTTDFGSRDYYVGAFKGEILSVNPSLQVVDLSHHIPPFNIQQAAYILGNSYTHFPKGTIHVARVFESESREPKIVVCHYNDHYFVAPDNGLLSLIFDKVPPSAVRIDRSRITLKTPHDLYCKAIRTIVFQGSLSDLGPLVNGIVTRQNFRPTIGENNIRGVVLHIDNFGNAITNINRADFDAARKERDFVIWLRRNNPIERLHRRYNDVTHGEQLARFNSKGILEIAIHCGSAAELLGLTAGYNVLIDFVDADKGS